MKLTKYYLLPLSLTLLSPLCAEQFTEEADYRYEDEQSFAAYDEDDAFEQEEMAVKQPAASGKPSLPNSKKAPSSSNKIVQQQGKSSSYDRNVLHQNHSTAQRQTTASKSSAGQQKPAAKSLQRAKPIALSNDQMSAPSAPADMNQTMTKTSQQFNTPARPPLKDALNLWVMGEALLWQANEENLAYVYSGNDFVNEHIRNFHTVDFDWDWGFRVGLGYNAPRDGWDLGLQWTHIENHAEGSERAHLTPSGGATGENDRLFPIWQIDQINVLGDLAKAKAHWTVHLEQVDLSLGKEYYVGRHLTLRPIVGARADWIFQEYDVKYTPFFFPDSIQKVELRNRYFGFGFFGGLDTDWLLGKGFSIYGMADFAALVGFFDTSQHAQQTNQTTGITEKGTDTFSQRNGRGVLDLSLGLKWCHLFHKSSWGITFKAGYEYHVFFDQNQFILETASVADMFKPEGDLTYQGVTISGQFDF